MDHNSETNQNVSHTYVISRKKCVNTITFTNDNDPIKYTFIA